MCLAIAKYKGVVVPHEYLQAAMKANSDGTGFAYHEDGQVHIAKGYTKFDDFMNAYLPHEQKTAIIHFRWTTHGSNGRANCHPFELADGALIHNGIISGMGDNKYDFQSHYTQPKRTLVGPITGRKYDRYSTLRERRDLLIELMMYAHSLTNDKRGLALAEKILDEEMTAHPGKNDWTKTADLINEYEYVSDDKTATTQRDLRSDTREFCEDYLAGWTEDMLRKGKKMIEKVIGGGSKLATLHNSGRILLFNENSGHWNEGAWYSNGCYKQGASYSSHIPQGASRGQSMVVGREPGPVREYTTDAQGVLQLVKETPAKKESGAEVVELRPAKDSHPQAFLDTMIDGLLESSEDESELSSQRDWLAEFPGLTAMALHGGED